MWDKINYQVIISSCGKYSDLWDAHIQLMHRNWPEHGKAYLVTDTPTDRTFEDVEVICAGEGVEFTDRLKLVLDRVETEYVLFTLDDYFLTEKIDSQAIRQAMAVMSEQRLDYLRLYQVWNAVLRREHAVEIPGYKGYYLRDTSEGNYKISLYPGIWRTDFMRQTLRQPMNAWEYEVSLTEIAEELHARCAVNNNRIFPFMDVIRKGKVLREANRYFRKNPIYQSDRPVRTVWEEWKLNSRTVIGRLLPKPLFRIAKKLMIRLGMKFYSPTR